MMHCCTERPQRCDMRILFASFQIILRELGRWFGHTEPVQVQTCAGFLVIDFPVLQKPCLANA